MTNDEQREKRVAQSDPAAAARVLMRRARTAALATLEAGTGHPYGSLVAMATEPDGTPLLLISRLALHTRNVRADVRASLLVEEREESSGDPLAGGRLTVMGELQPTQSGTARARFLARHRTAEGYVSFGDFAFYALTAARAHFVGGFGRIVDLDRPALILPVEGAGALIQAEADILAHMNADHSDALELYATRLLSGPPGPWRMTGIDPFGLDLALGARSLRLEFAEVVPSPEAARQELERLAAAARSS